MSIRIMASSKRTVLPLPVGAVANEQGPVQEAEKRSQTRYNLIKTSFGQMSHIREIDELGYRQSVKRHRDIDFARR